MDRRQMLFRAADAYAACNRGDAEGMVAFMAEDVIWRDVALGMPLHGRDALQQAVQEYMTAFPDLHVEVTSSTIDGARLVQELTVTGTHRGELMGMPPTGRWTKSYIAVITTFDDDDVMIEGAVYWNPLVMLWQIGLAPMPEGAIA